MDNVLLYLRFGIAYFNVICEAFKDVHTHNQYVDNATVLKAVK